MHEVPLVSFSEASFKALCQHVPLEHFWASQGKESYSHSVLCTLPCFQPPAILSRGQAVTFAACAGHLAGWACRIRLLNFADASKLELSRHLCTRYWLPWVLAPLRVLSLLSSERPGLLLPTCGCNTKSKSFACTPRTTPGSWPHWLSAIAAEHPLSRVSAHFLPRDRPWMVLAWLTITISIFWPPGNVELSPYSPMKSPKNHLDWVHSGDLESLFGLWPHYLFSDVTGHIGKGHIISLTPGARVLFAWF